jgi:hypothetical protein
MIHWYICDAAGLILGESRAAITVFRLKEMDR